MLSSQILTGVTKQLRLVICSRNIGVAAPVLQKATDPIQQLFIQKIQEYKQKAGGDGKLVDSSPETERELKTELEKVAKTFGGGDGVDLSKFPDFKFSEPKIDPIVAVEPVAKK